VSMNKKTRNNKSKRFRKTYKKKKRSHNNKKRSHNNKKRSHNNKKRNTRKYNQRGGMRSGFGEFGVNGPLGPLGSTELLARTC